MDLHTDRNADEPIRYASMEAYGRLTGRVLDPDEVDAVKMLDGVFRKQRNESLEERRNARSG